ncbi:MAG TPA: MFS transporter [Oribacterium sp.]|nr:MFS transporter [Oribacterium sp.]
MSDTPQKNPALRNAGFILFFLSGICAISSGVIVSILRDRFGLSFSSTGTLLSIMSAGNIVAPMLAGFLPAKIGMKRTVMLLTIGYFFGYLLCAFTGVFGLLAFAFLIIGLTKGSALSNCTVLVSTNAEVRTRAMNVLHACYAAGALLCPFLIQAFLGLHDRAPMIGIALAGLLMWFLFIRTESIEERSLQARANAGARKADGETTIRSAAAQKSEVSTPAATSSTTEVPGGTAHTAVDNRYAFLRDATFWILTALVFCQNAAEQSVNGWLVTYFKSEQILSGSLANYTVSIMWGATLIARLLIAFVIPIKNLYKALSVMGLSLTVLYAVLVQMHAPLSASVALFLFAFAMAGVNPLAIAGVGQMTSSASMGVLLSTAACGAIIMPYIIGCIGDAVSLQAGMAANLVPCIGIFVLSFVMYRRTKK